jgi:hypothetical protein
MTNAANGISFNSLGIHLVLCIRFSPVFTSLWGAVEVNAVQTKYDIDRGALAGLKNENTSP